MGLRTRAAVLGTVLERRAHGRPERAGRRQARGRALDARLTGRPFTVTSAAGRSVLRGRLRAATGSARPWRHAAIADLSAVRAPGAYRVRAAGLTAARSWVVADGAAGEAVRTVLPFFAVNADGDERSPAHAPSHLAGATLPDGTHADLAGGWMDAGDTLKFTGTNAYCVVALLLAARLDPAATPRAASTPPPTIARPWAASRAGVP